MTKIEYLVFVFFSKFFIFCLRIQTSPLNKLLPDNFAPPSSVCFPACYWTSHHPTPLPKSHEARRTPRPLLCHSAPPSAGLQTGSPAREWRGAAAGERKTQLASGLLASASSSSLRFRECGLKKRGQGSDGEDHLGWHPGASEGRCTWAWLRLAAPVRVRGMTMLLPVSQVVSKSWSAKTSRHISGPNFRTRSKSTWSTFRTGEISPVCAETEFTTLFWERLMTE